MSWQQTRSSPAPPGAPTMNPNQHHQPNNYVQQPPPPQSNQQQPPPPTQHYQSSQQQAAVSPPNHFNHIQQAQQAQQWNQFPNQLQPLTNANVAPAKGYHPNQPTPNNNWFVPNQSAVPTTNQQHPQGLIDSRHTSSHSPNVNFAAQLPPQQHPQPQQHQQQPQQPQKQPQQHQQQPQQQPIQHENYTYPQTNQSSIPFQPQPSQYPQTLGNAVMSGEPDQLRASALFDNTQSTGTTDGWDDEWSWTDNSNNNSINSSSHGPLSTTSINSNASPMATFQAPPPLPQQPQQPQYQHSQQMQPPPPPQAQQQHFPQQAQPQAALQQQQQQHHFQPPPLTNPTQDFFSKPSTDESTTGAPFLDTNHQSNTQILAPQLFQPPQMPAPAQSPYLPYNATQQAPNNVANFADSFNANHNATWDWHNSASSATILNPLADTPSTFLDTVPAQFATVGQASAEKYNSRIGTESVVPSPTYNHSQPDDPTHTQNAGVRSAVSASGNQLTPQWSIESQVSQTSSDLSLDTRSSLTNTSEEHPYQQKFPPKPFPYGGHDALQHQQPIEEVDLLEQTLQSLNVGAQGNNAEITVNAHADPVQPYWQPQQFNVNPEGQGQPALETFAVSSDEARQNQLDDNAFANKPNESCEPIVQNTPSLSHPSEQLSYAQSMSPFMPPPSMPPREQSPFVPVGAQEPPLLPLPTSQSSYDANPASNVAQFNNPSPQFNNPSPQLAPPTQFQLPPLVPPTQSGPASNPFKRTGIATHKTLQFQSATPLSAPTLVNQVAQPIRDAPPTAVFQLQPPLAPQDQGPLQPDNSEVLSDAPHNDRNQYLQTGHLSEETTAFSAPATHDQQLHTSDSNDYLPPPGLSRLVLGQPEITLASNPAEPPPGLDRMVPGTELTNSTQLNLERQADGQDTSAASAPLQLRSAVIGSFSNASTTPVAVLPISGHQEPLQNTDRNLYLVLGDESDSGQIASGQRVVDGRNTSDEPPAVSQSSIGASEQRELVMDGENLEDDAIRGRDEPLEGANTLDGPQQSPVVPETISVDVAHIAAPKKFNDGSLAGSTGNDDSDRERTNYYNRAPPRRSDEAPRRRDKQATDQQRYDTEDTDYYSDREREQKRFGREGSARRTTEHNDRVDRERAEVGRNRGERRGPVQSARSDKYRDDRRVGDRYEKDRYRYETDGSRYETEDYRYNRHRRERGSDGHRRDDRYLDDRERDLDTRRGKNTSSRGNDRFFGHDEYSQRSSSRNATDRTDKLSKRYGPEVPSYYPQQAAASQSSYGIDQYHQYYQQVQYYEHLRRTNPQAYAELYHRMYGQQDSLVQQQTVGLPTLGVNESQSTGLTDGRESVHSGRSSTNGRYSSRQAATSKQLQQRFYDPASAYRQQQPFSHQHNSTMKDQVVTNGQPSANGRSTPSPFISHISYTQDIRSSNRFDSGTAADSMTVDEEPARMKFTIDHTSASLANGLMVCVKPQFSAHADFTSVVRIMQIGVKDSTRRLFELYPGPLARGVTHKKTVIEFCEEQIRLGPQASNNATLKSRGNSMSSVFSQQAQPVVQSSYTLMWNLLILLLRQNGVVVGTDISELLMQNKKEFPYDVLTDSTGSSSIGQPESVAEEDGSPTADGSDGPMTPEEQIVSASHSTSRSITEEEITERFRNYLLYGSINEALDWATDNSLWGHALFLASKVDRRSHANVLMKFANKLSLNDPLQTLYQLMSGRTPNSVTSIQDEKWGDWRPHLAMILANTSPNPEIDRKSITTLGDSLYNRGDLFAAQFCYLMAQAGFGRYSYVNQESVLMSSSSNAIRLILLGSSHHRPLREFATNEAIMMTEIYEYACTLNDDHFSIVEFQVYKYLLATRMLDSGLNIKSLMYLEQIAHHIQKNPTRFDESFIGKVYTLSDQLKYFDPVYERMMYEADNSKDGPLEAAAIEDQPWLQELAATHMQYNSTSNKIYSNEPIQYAEPATTDSLSTINQQFSEINQQFSNLNMQYAAAPAETAPPSSLQYQQYQSLPTHTDQPIFDPYGQNQIAASYDLPAQPSSLPANVDNYGYDNVQTFQPAANEQTPLEPNNYDYWNQQQQQQQQHQEPYQADLTEPEMAKPSISMPNSMSNKPNFYADDEPSGGGGSKSAGASGATGKSDKSVLPAKNSGQSSTSNSGWFGGIWNKLSLKPKNQMILPDDKNPAIVWDSDKKKWVNTDGVAEEAEQFRPPPKMADLAPRLGGGGASFAAPIAESPSAGPPQQQSYDPPMASFGSSAPPAFIPSVPSAGPIGNSLATAPPAGDPSQPSVVAKTPSLQSNMFKKQRNQTLKKSYVDVFNPSGAPAKPIETAMMAPLLPTGPPGGFFIPGAAPTGQAQDDGNHFYNPNQFAGANGPSSYQ